MRRNVQILAWTLIWSGVFIFGYLGWQLYGTDVVNAAVQAEAHEELEQAFENTEDVLPEFEEIDPAVYLGEDQGETQGLVEFFSEEESPKVVFSPKDRIPVSGRGASRFEILVAGSTNNEMDPFFVSFSPGESFEIEEPHVGEEFGFVLSGSLTLELSGRKQKISAKSCFYIESNQPHRLLNTSERDVSFIWVTAPPQM
ncbi:MAG: cupin domain-containing protein [Actinobacteria bacterium]|nr:cupin domain-containing protein [Actinomycetota bacterium]